MSIVRRRIKRRDDDTGVDMTPMLDIVFILLIFFIVTAVFIKEQGIDLTQTPDAPPGPTMAAIHVHVFANGTASVNGVLTEVEGVPARVQLLRTEKPNAAVQLGADGAAAFGNVVYLKDKFAIANIPMSLKIHSLEQ